MGKPAAKQGDQVMAVDIHIIMIPTPGGPVPTPLPHPFSGKIVTGTVPTVLIQGMPAAVMGSEAKCVPPHIPQGGPFQKPPMNSGKIIMGSTTVHFGGKPAARIGDPVMTCNDPVDLPIGNIIGVSTVLIGG